MALVKMLASISGVRDGEAWPKAGEIADFHDAEDLIRAGLAEAVSKVEKAAVKRPAKVETASVEA